MSRGPAARSPPAGVLRGCSVCDPADLRKGVPYPADVVAVWRPWSRGTTMSGADADKLIGLLERLVVAFERLAARPAGPAPEIFVAAGHQPPSPAADTGREGGTDEPSHGRAYLTPIEAAERIGCSRSMVYKLMGRGELSYRRVGREYRIEPRSVEEYKRASAVGRSPSMPAAGGYQFKHI